MPYKFLALLGVILISAVPLVVPTFQFILTIAMAKGFAALGVALLLRGGLISLGHAMFFGTGAYITAFLAARANVTDIFIIVVCSTVLASLFGFLIGMFLARFRAIFFAMLNLAISMVVYSLVSKLYRITGGTDGLSLPVPTLLGQELEKATFDAFLYYFALLLLVVACFLVHRYLRSPLGYALLSVHTNEVRLEYLGVSAWSTILVAYTISAGLAGLGGVIAAAAIGHVLPEFAYWTESGHFVLTAVLGGIGGTVGPFIGSFFLEIIHKLAVGYAADSWNMIIGGALLLVIFFLPNGLFGVLRSLTQYNRQKAEKKG